VLIFSSLFFAFFSGKTDFFWKNGERSEIFAGQNNLQFFSGELKTPAISTPSPQ